MPCFTCLTMCEKNTKPVNSELDYIVLGLVFVGRGGLV